MKRNDWIKNKAPRPTHTFCGKCGHVVKVKDKCELCEAKLRAGVNTGPFFTEPIDPFVITSNPTVRWDQLELRRYDVLDRVRERMSRQISEQEEAQALERLQQYMQRERLNSYMHYEAE